MSASSSGNASEKSNPLDALIDKTLIREALEDIVGKARAKSDFCRRNNISARMQLSFVITGDAGTGKTTVAQTIAAALAEAGILKSPIAEVVNPVDYDNWIKNIAKNAQRLANSALIVEEAQKLVPEGEAEEVAKLDHILQLARRWREDDTKPVIIITGSKRLRNFFNENPNSASAINYFFETEEITIDGLMSIALHQLKEKYRRTLTPEAEEKLRRIFIHDRRDPDGAMGTAGHNAAARAYSIDLAALGTSSAVLGPECVKGREFRPKTLPEVMAEFDKYVGVDEVKQAVRSIANSVAEEVKAGHPPRVEHHYQFLGNPGTGKTTMARLFADALNAIGALPVGHLKEVSKDDLVSKYVGGSTSKVVDEFQKAMGGVLFIDEAYNLIPMANPNDKDRDGTAAVEALMTRMSNDAGKFITVIAGYKAEIEEFIANANPGLARRFTHRIHIDDYSPEALVEIFMGKVRKDNFILTADAEELLRKKVQEMVTMKDKNFGNAGAMMKLYNQTLERQADRLGGCMDNLTDDQMFTIEASDIPYEAPRKVDIRQCMKELDQLVGLDSVKKMVHELADTIAVEQERAAMEGRQPKYPMSHYLFLGNPGTGKTTVARIMGDIFYSLGLLPSNKLVEVKPSDMIIGFVGQTAAQTRKMIDRGLGGVLFIDEAYGLNDGHSGTKDATPEMLTLLNDYKGRMVCIAAGYPREMSAWLASNSGLSRRFETTLHFDDYTADELSTIFLNILEKEGMKADELALEEMHEYFNMLVFNKSSDFGNAAEAVKYFNIVKINQGARLRRLGSYDREELY